MTITSHPLLRMQVVHTHTDTAPTHKKGSSDGNRANSLSTNLRTITTIRSVCPVYGQGFFFQNKLKIVSREHLGETQKNFLLEQKAFPMIPKNQRSSRKLKNHIINMGIFSSLCPYQEIVLVLHWCRDCEFNHCHSRFRNENSFLVKCDQHFNICFKNV